MGFLRRGRRLTSLRSTVLVGALVAGSSLAGANVAQGQVEQPTSASSGGGAYVSEAFPAGSGSQPSSAAVPAPHLDEGLGAGNTDTEPTGTVNSEAPTVVQRDAAFDAAQQLTPPLTTFAGQNTGSNPPDPVGDVGPNHYIQMINSNIQIWDKAGTSLQGSIPINQIWLDNTTAGTGFDQCRNQNAGDPIVLYDQQADRWMISQFTTPSSATGPGGTFPMCIAYSRTGNPVGTTTGGTVSTAGVWWVYQFNLPASHDYMKYGIWPDGLYMSTWEGGTLGAYVFDRSAMLDGSPATFQSFTGLNGGTGVDSRGNRIIPSDWDGNNPPPAGAPNYFMTMLDGAFDGGNDRLEIREFHVDWNVPANTTLNLVTTLNTAPFDSDLGCAANGGIRTCIPQPGTTTRLDALANRLMHRLQYRNLGDHQAMVVSQTVDATTDNTNRAGIRWYELRNTGAGWTIFQQGTYAPNDGVHRWMPSAAMDGRGNIAIGYSVSDGTSVFPGLRYTARHATDPLGSMSQGEQVLIDGTASEDSNRWGDYASMNVDPVDDCTFWFTGERDQSATTVGSFRLTSCNETDLSITKTDSPDPVSAGEQLNYTLTATNNGPNVADAVTVVDTLPAGVTFVSASAGCTHDAGVVTCSVGQLLTGQSVPLSIQVRVPPGFLGSASSATLTNVATIAAANQSDSNPGNNTATATTTVQARADLAVTKVCKPDNPAEAGEDGFCDIHVDNLGPSDAVGVTLTDVVTSATPFSVISTTVTPSGTCAPPSSGPTTSFTTVCDLGTEPAGGRSTIRIVISVEDEAQVNDVATVESTTPDPDTTNNQAEGRIDFVGSADLSLTKTGPDEVVAGEQITYEITVRNDGPSTAQDVVVDDQLPLGVSFVSVTPSQGTCTNGQPGARDLECGLGDMAAASEATITIVGLVAPDVPPGTILFNEAIVSSATADPDNDDVRSSVATDVVGSADLSVTKTDSPDPVVAGSQVTYTITVANAGPSTAQSVVITDDIPAQTTYVSGQDGNGATVCTLVQTGDVVCSLGAIQPGGTETVYLTVLVSPATNPGAILTDTVTVTSSIPDPDPTNDTDTEGTTVGTSAEIWLDKTATLRSGNPSPVIVFSLMVHNDAGCESDAQSSPGSPVCGAGGPSDARDVVVTDVLPLDARKLVVQYVSPQCTYTRATHTVRCTATNIPAGAQVQFVIEAQANGSVGTITNRASVISSTTDPVTSNNADDATIVVKGGTGGRGGPR